MAAAWPGRAGDPFADVPAEVHARGLAQHDQHRAIKEALAGLDAGQVAQRDAVALGRPTRDRLSGHIDSGAADVSVPAYVFGVVLLLLFLPGLIALYRAFGGGWTLYPPLTVQQGIGMDFTIFAVHILGMSSILGSIITGFGLGVIEGLTKVFYPEASNTVVFVIMAIVLLVKPAGLFGRTP